MFEIPYPQRSGTVHDQVFKDLIGTFLPELVTLVAPEPAAHLNFSHWELLNKETFTDWPKGRRREIDLLAKVERKAAGGRKALVHVEVEAHYRRKIGRRLSLAALMRPASLSPAEHKWACLQRISAAPVNDLSRFLLANCVETYLQLEGHDAAELEALQARGNAEEVREMSTRRLTWAEQFEEKGWYKGVEKGLSQGVEQGVRQTLLRLLGARFGPLSDHVKQRVEAIHSVEHLNQIADQILVARSLEEMGLQ